MFGVVTVVIGGAIKSKHMDPEVAHVPVRPSPRLARLLTVNLQERSQKGMFSKGFGMLCFLLMFHDEKHGLEQL